MEVPVSFCLQQVELRHTALADGDLRDQRTHRLLFSSPFSSDIFGDEESLALKDSFLLQACSFPAPLSFLGKEE